MFFCAIHPGRELSRPLAPCFDGSAEIQQGCNHRSLQEIRGRHAQVTSMYSQVCDLCKSEVIAAQPRQDTVQFLHPLIPPPHESFPQVTAVEHTGFLLFLKPSKSLPPGSSHILAYFTLPKSLAGGSFKCQLTFPLHPPHKGKASLKNSALSTRRHEDERSSPHTFNPPKCYWTISILFCVVKPVRPLPAQISFCAASAPTLC